MIAGWMVLVLIIGCLLAAAAACLHSLQRTAERPVRWVWSGAMALLLVLAAAAPWRGGSLPKEISVVGSPAASAVAAPMALATPLERAVAAARSARDAISEPIARAVAAASRAPIPVQRSLAIVWLLSALGALVLMVRVMLRVRRLRRGWPCQELQGALVRVSPDAGPAVMGIAPPEIVVPAWILTRTGDEQRLVLAHEQQHVIARDPLLLMLACIAVAVMPWHPAMWYLWSRLRLAVELDCDRRVLRAGAAPRDYGRLLIDLTGHRSALSSGIPAFSYSASQLERRLLAMTSTPSRFLIARRVSGALIASLAILAACESNLPTSAEIRSMDVAATTKRAAASGLDTANVRYVVDGQLVTEEVAKTLPAERIATITVAKAPDRSGKTGPVVEVRTVAEQSLPREKGDSVGSNAAEAVSRARKFSGLLMVDGVITESSKLDGMDPSSIETIEIVKGPAGSALYADPRAANGVIKITTKKKS